MKGKTLEEMKQEHAAEDAAQEHAEALRDYLKPLQEAPEEIMGLFDKAVVAGANALEQNAFMVQRMKRLQRDVGDRDQALRELSSEYFHKTQVQAMQERIYDAAWKFIVKKVPSVSCDEVRRALSTTPEKAP